MENLDQRLEIARYLLAAGTTALDEELYPDVPPGMDLTADLGIVFPDELGPVPQPFDIAPEPDAPLPAADVVLITWTVAEQNALADVFTPKFGRLKWYRYTRRFDEHYRPLIRNGAPSIHPSNPRLGSYFMTTVGALNVLCVKSELHLNQDGKKTDEGTATLPVKDFFQQIIEEVQPKWIITAGTSGSVFVDYALGDVVVTRAAKFRCSKEFRNEPFNDQIYTSDWQIPTSHIAAAEELMQQFAGELTEPPLAPPSKLYPFEGEPIVPPPNEPKIWLEQGAEHGMPEFHPILTTDYFEYGTSSNGLEEQGCAVEMGDAVLGLVCTELGDDAPKWVVVRNMSDPQINGDLATKEYNLNPQTMWAVAFYEAYGYWTSVTGALAAWAIIAGLATQND